MKPCVVIATYNERENIASLLNQILDLAIADLTIIVVDDNSPDGTADVVRQSIDSPAVRLIVRTTERGYGSAHIRGIQVALDQGSQAIITMDADFSHQPSVIPTMLKTIEEGYDVVIGSRRIEGGQIIGWGIVRTAASKTAMIIARRVMGINTRDVTTGFRAYRAAIFEQLNIKTIKSNGYSFLQELIYRCESAQLKIKEIPIVFRDRERGKSKFSIQEIIKFFMTLAQLRLNKK